MRWVGGGRTGEFVVQARLFVVSYAPLLAIFAVESKRLPEALGFAVGTVLALIMGIRLVTAAGSRTARRADLSDVEDRSGQAAGYLASYLLPFIGGPPTTLRLTVAYILYFAVAFLVSMRADSGLVNPTLYLFGYRVVAATVRDRRVLIVCRDARVNPGSHRVVQMMGGAGYVLADEESASPSSDGRSKVEE